MMIISIDRNESAPFRAVRAQLPADFAAAARVRRRRSEKLPAGRIPLETASGNAIGCQSMGHMALITVPDSFQVCDGQWHHYAVSMEFPNVQLFVDGHPLIGTKNNPEIIDDWPLHSSHGLSTILTVGACWQGNIAQC